MSHSELPGIPCINLSVLSMVTTSVIRITKDGHVVAEECFDAEGASSTSTGPGTFRVQYRIGSANMRCRDLFPPSIQIIGQTNNPGGVGGE